MYLRRQEGRVGAKASAGPINQAIAGYDKATADPHFVEARWKLMRALYFKGCYTGLDDDSKKAVFEKAKRVGEEAIEILGSSLEERGIKGFIEFGPDALAGNLKDRSDARADVLLGGGLLGPVGARQRQARGGAQGSGGQDPRLRPDRDRARPAVRRGRRLSDRRAPQRPGALDPVPDGVGLAGGRPEVPAPGEPGRRPELREPPLPRRGPPPRATRRSRPRRFRSRRRWSPTRPRRSGSSRSCRCRRWRGENLAAWKKAS